MLTLTLATLTILTLASLRLPAHAGDVDYQTRFRLAHRRAVQLRGQRDDLQRRLTRRVVEVRRLQRALRQRIAAVGGHPLERDFLCIYSHENGGYGWAADTSNGYYGGLQMDLSFQRTYGPEFLRAFGTADRWPASVQIAVAIKAYLSGRGFHPWPNTSRMCGLR